MESPFVALSQVARAFEAQKIPYVVVGSFASSLHGLYRTTNDIDLVAEIKLEQVAPLVASLQQDFYIDELAARRAVIGRSSFNAIHFDSVFKIDVFVPRSGDFSQQQLTRRQPANLSPDVSQIVYVATAEDTILAKLKWYRSGKEISNTQWTDVLGVIGAQGKDLDLGYLRAWAGELGVGDLLDKILDEAR
jgi:hypothetical protein